MTDELHDLTGLAKDIAERAGRAVIDIYNDTATTDTRAKADGSPLTRADTASHHVIVDALHDATPTIPILSEESEHQPLATRIAWTRYWLIDPLDGTKEFIARNGEFTINIALIDATDGVGSPTLGVVHLPATGLTYTGTRGHGAHRHATNARTPISPTTPDDTIRVVASRSHGNPDTDAFIDGLTELGHVERTTSGSSLKLCRVADGSAHYYPRIAPTMAWDTAAAQAVVEAAGAVVWRYGTRHALRYDARTLRNPPFLVAYGVDARLPGGYGALDSA